MTSSLLETRTNQQINKLNDDNVYSEENHNTELELNQSPGKPYSTAITSKNKEFFKNNPQTISNEGTSFRNSPSQNIDINTNNNPVNQPCPQEILKIAHTPQDTNQIIPELNSKRPAPSSISLTPIMD